MHGPLKAQCLVCACSGCDLVDLIIPLSFSVCYHLVTFSPSLGLWSVASHTGVKTFSLIMPGCEYQLLDRSSDMEWLSGF